MKSQNTIELNGTRYDVSTGTAMNKQAPTAAVARNIDGFFKPARTQASQRTTSVHSPQTQTARPAVVTVAQPAVQSSITVKNTHNPNHVVAHKPQAARTLMRSAVKQPEKGLKQKVHVQVGLQHETPNLISVKQSAYSLDQDRAARAAAISRSEAVSRHIQVSGHTTSVTPLLVQPIPVKPEAVEQPAVPAPQPTNKPLDMFEHAIANASHYVDVKAHHAKFKKHRRNHAFSLAASSLALLLVAGFVAYQNSPSLQLKVASLRSGVSASTPDLANAGFTYDGAKAGDGTLTVGLKNQSGTYAVSQQDSNWDNVDLIQNIGTTDASGTPTYSTVKTGNVEAYRFSNNDATWVNNGKLYTVSGTTALTDSQVSTLIKNL